MTQPLDKDAVRFLGRAIRIAMEFGGSVDDKGAGDYSNRLYAEFTDSGNSSVDAWLRDRLSSEFRYILSPPVWVESEPSWAYHNGKPMVFISQVDLPENEVTASRLGYDQTVYLFGCRLPQNGEFELHYETRTQIRGVG